MKKNIRHDQQFFNLAFIGTILLIFVFLFSFKDKPNQSKKGNRRYRPDIISCSPRSVSQTFDSSIEEVTTNDNRKSAGEFRDGIYYVNLEIREGNWYPESKDARPIKITAMAEAGKPLQIPGPLIRVPEGTEIRATITNQVAGQPHSIFGFYRRPHSNLKDSIIISPGETKQINFNAGIAGTYFYYGNRGPFPHIAIQLYGALIVDAKNEQPDPAERIIMIGVCLEKVDTNLMRQYVMNGLTWPYTERLLYRQGELVKWRVINASRAPHPMHLHGFPFTLHSLGNIATDSIVGKEKEQLMVTQELKANTTMRISWIPSREGNWLFHCHLLDHILPVSYLRKQEEMYHSNANLETHAKKAMAGLIMGIHVLPDKKFQAQASKNKLPERKLTLIIGEKENYFDNSNGKGFQLWENARLTDPVGQGKTNGFSIPGPPLVLIKGQPVAIKIVNTLKESTTMHWHGLEIDSYYDGVPGWGYLGNKLAPLIQPGDSFTVHLTPPRAGTFMYHTHMHDLQLLQGMYGALIVLNPGETYNPETDKILLISQGGQGLYVPKMLNKNADLFGKNKSLLNGTSTPETMYLKKGKHYRFRIINIGAQNFGNHISIKQNDKLASWTLIAKDGMSLRKSQRQVKPSWQWVAIGETYDFEFSPAQTGEYRIELGSRLITSKPEITQLMKVEE
jgi:FtsP/CotA-like multicopper oxidase with cupredoxin domain